MSGAHAKLSPSGASRWMRCTMAPTMEAGFPDQTSAYASEGTVAHRFAERYAAEAVGIPLGAVPQAMPRDQEMLDACQFYANYIKEIYLELKVREQDPAIFLEQRLDLTKWIPEGFGTADCLIIADGVLNVIDFKYGKGVEVSAELNVQMMIYALGALEWARMMYDIETVRMTIIQPRLGGVSSDELTAAELEKWADEILKKRAEAAYSGNGEFRPGEETCRFCKASGSCKAQAEYFLNLFDENENTEVLSLKEKAELLEKASGLTSWLKALEESVFDGLMNGESVPGWKLVEGKSNRKYTNEEEVAKRLKAKRYKAADLYEKKLIGIGKMEKLVGKRKLAEICGDLIVKPKGKPSLAPASDKRPAYSREEEISNAFDED